MEAAPGFLLQGATATVPDRAAAWASFLAALHTMQARHADEQRALLAQWVRDNPA